MQRIGTPKGASPVTDLLIGAYGFRLAGSTVGSLSVALVAAGAALPGYARRIPRAIRGSWFAGLGRIGLLALAQLAWSFVN